VDHLFDTLDILHHTVAPVGAAQPTADMIVWNWSRKLEERMLEYADIYTTLPRCEEIRDWCLAALKSYTPVNIAQFIHGDLWFSNIILRFNNTVAFVDMRGKVRDCLTTGGDRNYDYAKLWQSVCGYDDVLHGLTSPENSHVIRAHVGHCLKLRGVDVGTIHTLMITLVVGTLAFIEDVTTRQRVWSWILELREPTVPL
jgi:hypothetical protein